MMKSSTSLTFAALCIQLVSATRRYTNDTTVQANATSLLATLLNQYFYPNPNASQGVFNLSEGPWWESGTIWQTYMDFAQYTGDETFSETVGAALTSASYNETHDYLGENHNYTQTVESRWNDDIMWYALAVVAGSEVYGSDAVMPGPSGDDGTWTSLAQLTADEVYENHTEACGGGILWPRNPYVNNTYKSSITNTQYVSLAARTAMVTDNETLIELAEKNFRWLASSGTISLQNGTVNDGVDSSSCNVSTSQWSYTYGMLVGGLAWLSQATGNTTYLSLAGPFLNTIVRQFAPTGVVRENCELDGSCNNDQMNFKGILLRNLAYLYRVTSNADDKTTIRSVIEKSAAAAVATCRGNWQCSGEWVNGTQVYPAYRSVALVGAALVAELGIGQ